MAAGVWARGRAGLVNWAGALFDQLGHRAANPLGKGAPKEPSHGNRVGGDAAEEAAASFKHATQRREELFVYHGLTITSITVCCAPVWLSTLTVPAFTWYMDNPTIPASGPLSPL